MTQNSVKTKPSPASEKKTPNGGGKVVRSVVTVMSGSFLSKDQTLKHLPFMFFLTLLVVIYIGNGYYAEEKVRQLNKLTYELKELTSDYVTTSSELAFSSKQTEVAAKAMAKGVVESVEPPRKVIVKTDTTKKE